MLLDIEKSVMSPVLHGETAQLQCEQAPQTNQRNILLLALHPDAGGRFWHQGKMRKV